MSSTGMDDSSYSSMSLHIWPNLTYGLSSTAVLHLAPELLYRVQVGAAGRQKLQLQAVQILDRLLDDLCLVLWRPVDCHQDFAEPLVGLLQKVRKLVLGEPVVPLEEAIPVGGDQPEDYRLGVGSGVRVDGPHALGGVDTPSEPGVGHHDCLVLYAYRVAVVSLLLYQRP